MRLAHLVPAAPAARRRRAHTSTRTRTRTGAVAALVLGLSLVPTASQASSSRLTAGHTLTAGQKLVSPNGRNELVFQSDGNLVEYSGGTAIWCTDTNGVADGGYVVVHDNGAVHVHTASGAIAWSSDTSDTGTHNYLSVQDDGNVVVYDGGGRALYSAKARATTLFPGTSLYAGQSLVSVNEDYTATMDSDGNFVVRRGSTALWSSGTAGKAIGGHVTMRTDGDLVVYTSGGSRVWSSGTGDAGSMLVMQDDANLVMYKPYSNSAPWSSHTYNGAAMTPQHYAAQYMLGNYRWGSDKFPPLDKLWTRESNWRWDADNPYSSAYGIPQALPGSKMSSAGSDWETNPKTQIRWGLGYIKDRYSNPINAWAHSEKYGWYKQPR